MGENNNEQENSKQTGQENDLANKAKQLGKTQAKRIGVKILLHALPWILLIVIILVVSGSLFSIFSEVGQTISDLWQNFMESVTNEAGEIEITDEAVEEFIKQVEESTGVRFENLKLAGDIDYSAPDRQEEIKKANIKYVRMFLEAQLMTQEINRPGVDGGVHLYRAGADKATSVEATELKYTSPEDFDSKLESANSTGDEYILQFFTLNDASEIIVANKKETTVDGKLTKSFDKAPPQPYKNLISQYSTPAQFFIYLGEIVQSPKFLEEVVNLIKKDTVINLTILENTTTEETTETLEYDLLLREDVELGNRGNVGYRFVKEDPYQRHKEEKTTKTVTITGTLAVTYVNTWQIEQSMTYQRKDGQAQTTVTVSGQDGVPAIEDEEKSQDVDSVKVNQVLTMSSTFSSSTYTLTSAADYKYKAGEKPDADPSYTSFVDLLDKPFTLPNSTREVTAGPNLRSGAEWFFKLLAQDPNTSNLENFMRYVMNKYTQSNKYGDIEFEDLLSIFASRMVSIYGDDLVVNTAMMDASQLITDKETLRKGIEQCYSGQARTNLVNNVEAFLTMQDTYHVNAVFAVAVTIIESSGGTNWAAISPSTYNWISITGSYNGNSYVSGDGRHWRAYPSFAVATQDFGDLIANDIYYFRAGKYTVREIATSYCSDLWGQAVVSEMTKIYNAMGISVGGSSETGLYGNTVEEKVWFSLTEMGFSKQAAAGIMANIKQRSNFSSTAKKKIKSEEGVGLCLWSDTETSDRRSRLEAYAKSKGKTWDDENIQIQFLMGELKPEGGADGFAKLNFIPKDGNTLETLKSSTDEAEAAIIFQDCFDGRGIANQEALTNSAKNIYKKFKDLEAGKITKFLKTVDTVTRYVIQNGFTYVPAESGHYTFPIAQSGKRYLSCSSFLQECLYEAGFCKETRHRIYATCMNQTAAQNQLETYTNLKFEKITDMNQLQAGDILQFGTSDHVVVVYSKNGNNVVTKGFPEAVDWGFNGKPRTVDDLIKRKCYAFRIIG